MNPVRDQSLTETFLVIMGLKNNHKQLRDVDLKKTTFPVSNGMNPKIIVTIGPKSEDHETLKQMTLEGMNITRVNFSHGTPEQWLRVKDSLAKIKQETGTSVEMMADLQGPRIRIGQLEHELKVEKDKMYVLTPTAADVAKNEIPIDYADLYKFVKRGDPIYLHNRSVELEVERIAGKKIIAKVLKEGVLMSRKGINLPKTNIKITLTKKDKTDATFAAKNGADYINLSFVQDANSILQLRKIIHNDRIDIIAKIERASALDNIDSIIKAADGIMIARGDLGLEMPIEDLCITQKDLIRHAHQYKKPAIVATQMLDSMTKNPYPTRAEAADVGNAIFDGADGTMLSEETSIGDHPVVAVATMRRIVKRVDEYYNSTNYFEHIKHIA